MNYVSYKKYRIAEKMSGQFIQQGIIKRDRLKYDKE